tara:strand:+ start:501 stop:695 length:195 start_codon:yes stop_codon:yes gene_type:complete
MDNQRETASFRYGAIKIDLLNEAPQLTVDIWNEEEEPPAVKPWQMLLMIKIRSLCLQLPALKTS